MSSSSRPLRPPLGIDQTVQDADDPVGGFGRQIVQDLPDVRLGAGVRIAGRLIGQIAGDGRPFFGEAIQLPRQSILSVVRYGITVQLRAIPDGQRKRQSV